MVSLISIPETSVILALLSCLRSPRPALRSAFAYFSRSSSSGLATSDRPERWEFSSASEDDADMSFSFLVLRSSFVCWVSSSLTSSSSIYSRAIFGFPTAIGPLSATRFVTTLSATRHMASTNSRNCMRVCRS